MHTFLLVLIIYTGYKLIKNKKERTLTNILLFTIIISLDTLINQNSNLKKILIK